MSLPHRVHSLLSVCSPAVSEADSGTFSAIGLWWSPRVRGGKPKGRKEEAIYDFQNGGGGICGDEDSDSGGGDGKAMVAAEAKIMMVKKQMVVTDIHTFIKPILSSVPLFPLSCKFSDGATL